MIDVLIWVIAAPLIGALMTVALPRLASIVGVSATMASFLAAAFTLWQVASKGPVDHALGGWSLRRRDVPFKQQAPVSAVPQTLY